MCPLYVSGLIGPGDRKSVQPMAKRLVLGEYDQLHHFIAAGVWEASPVETELLVQADRLVGGRDAVLVIDDTNSTGLIRMVHPAAGSERKAKNSFAVP
jgi:SRSO17 transposase